MKTAELNYKRLMEIIPWEILKERGALKLKSEGFMDLSVNLLEDNRISITHYYEQNGDLVPDPDMEITIYPETKTAWAETFQDYRVYQTAEKHGYDLQRFLRMWLRNIKMQGHKLETEAAGV